MYILILWRHRTKTSGLDIKERKEASRHLEFLFDAYRDSCWGWEAVDSVRRCALTGLLVFFPVQSRVVFAAVMAIFFHALQRVFQPYAVSSNNVLAELANFSIAMILLVLIVASSGILHDAVVSALCIVLTMVVIPTVLFYQIANARYRKNVLRRFVVTKLQDGPKMQAPPDDDQIVHSPMHDAERSTTTQPIVNVEHFMQVFDCGEHSKRLLLIQLFEWVSEYTLTQPITFAKRRQLLDVMQLPPMLDAENGCVDIGLRFAYDGVRGGFIYGRAIDFTDGVESEEEDFDSEEEPAKELTRSETRKRLSLITPQFIKDTRELSRRRFYFDNIARRSEIVYINERDKTILFVQQDQRQGPIPYEVKVLGT